MTVLPGSLDYLYYNGVLDHIPYEAYEMITPVQTSSPMTAEQYISQAKQGLNYSEYNSSDTFIRQNSVQDNYDVQTELYGQDSKTVRDSVSARANEAKNKITQTPTIIKGLAGLGLIVGTLFLILRGKK